MRKTLLISLLCIFTIQVFSQSINEDYKALPEEFIQNSQDRYGSTVAIDGNYAVVGATMYKNFQGCAYVLFKNGETWEKVATLTASDAATNVILGYSVSISGENIVAGSSNDAAYVFTKPVSGWVDMTETAKLTVTDITPNRFGQYVSISGDNIVVTDYYDDDNGNSSGSAYVYTKPSGGWVNMTETAELTASDGAEYDYFGGRVSISGDNIVIGSHGEDDNGSNSGSVYVFTKPVGGWTTMTETAKLLASDGAADHHFGQSVYISGDIIIAGEDVDYQGGETGAVYVYTKPISGWENMTENAQLTASDGALVDRYGYSLCISGDDIVVGAFSDDDNGNNSGSAYVFSKPLSGWINMTETAKLTASDGAANDNFGWVSIDGENIIIGATGDDDNGGSSGAVYTYVKPISGWVNDTESQKIIADPYFSSTESVYGISVSIDGDYAIVGSYGYMSNQGCAYILHYTGTIWENIARLTASDGASYDYFGYSVSISGDHIVVGAYRDDDNGDNSGSAYIFTKPANGWVDMTQTAKITASDGDSGDEFGRSARISGNNIVIGAYRDDDNGNGSGSAYIFTKPSGGWEDMIQTAKLTASDGAYSDCFGYSTSISGDYIVIGALYSNNDGAAYVFTKPSGGWIDMTETAKLIASDNVGGNQDHLGYSVGISGDNIIAGAYWDNENGDYSGSAYVFTKPTEGWTNMTQTAKLTASDGAYTDYFGNSVSISGENIVIGAYSDDDIGTNSGSAYVFTKPAGAWSTMTETIKLTASDAGENNQFGRSVNISGSKVVVGAPENLDGVAYLYLIGPVITSHPEDQLDINSGISVTFSTTADNVDSYQWQVSTDGGSNFTDIADNAIYTNSATTTLNVVTEKEMNNYQYRCVVSNEWISEPSNSALLTIKSTTAINDLSSQSFSVYPNPATDNLYIEFKENQSGIVQIYDVTGKIITEKNCTEQTEKINISEFANGMYIVKIQSGENVISYKIMKE